ncbi:transglycosylase domain-containing protein [Epibacterium sp. DP7N7-1]|nr:transglycosylase domain-containing protein [Epibacterium sp. DP7N7-1]
MPSETAIDVSAGARPGYVIQVQTGDGRDLGSISSARPAPLELTSLPDVFINAVIAAEDERFLEHAGVDPVGILGAAVDTSRGKLRGGSTITQQMTKNTLVGNDRTIGRKVIEAMGAVRAHKDLGKQEVLRRYLQSAWYGRGVTGAMQAPMIWFGKSWSEINLAEAATLAAMLKGPSLYDPWKNPEITRSRRDVILTSMERLNWISSEDKAVAMAYPIQAIAPDTHETESRWERRAAVQDLDERDSVPSGGYASSTINQDWQAIAEMALSEAVRKVSPVQSPLQVSEARISRILAQEGELFLPVDLRAGLPSGTPYNSALLLAQKDGLWDILIAGTGLVEGVKISDPHPGYEPEVGDLVPVILLEEDKGHPVYGIRLQTKVEGAVVVLDPRTGAILASVGGVDAGLTEFDRTRAKRQPGSSIKPFLYLAALSGGFSPASAVDDIEYTWFSADGVPWRPRNYDHSQSGRIPMYSGLERSSNLAAAYLINRIGVEAMAGHAEAAGVYPEGGMVRHISTALGTSETTLRDLVSGFGAIVNDGMPRRPHAVEGIFDSDGQQIHEDFRRPGPIAGRSEISDLLGMMRGVVVRGTSSVAFRDHPVRIAGKTGTTQDWRDAWFVGVTPQLAIGVWLGRDNNQPLPNRMSGGTAAAPIAAQILRDAFDAEMIDANGLRDDTMSSSLKWPPAIHGGQLRQEVMPRQNPSAYTSGSDIDTGISGFWGSLEVQKRYEPIYSPEVNRNGDLLKMLR